MNSMNTLAAESERLYGKVAKSKACSPVTLSEVSAWAEEINSDVSAPYPLKSLKHPPHLRHNLDSSKTAMKSPSSFDKSKRKSENCNTYPDVVSMYEISKVSPKFKQFFDETKPCRNFRRSLKFPVINDKSLLSVYLTGNIGKAKPRLNLGKRTNVFEVCSMVARKYHGSKDIGVPSGSIMTLFNSINSPHKHSSSVGPPSQLSPSP